MINKNMYNVFSTLRNFIFILIQHLYIITMLNNLFFFLFFSCNKHSSYTIVRVADLKINIL